MGWARASLGDGRGDVNGDTVEDKGARGRPLREFCNHDVLPGLVPRFEWGDNGVDDRAICQGAGDERRITVGRAGGGEESGTVRFRCRQRISRTAFSSDVPDKEVFSRRKSSIFSTWSSSSRDLSWSIWRQSSRSSSATMSGFCRTSGDRRVDKAETGGGGEAAREYQGIGEASEMWGKGSEESARYRAVRIGWEQGRSQFSVSIVLRVTLSCTRDIDAE